VPLTDIVAQRLPAAMLYVTRQVHWLGGALALIGVICARRVAGRAAWLLYSFAAVSILAVVHLFSPLEHELYWLFTLAVAALAACGLAAVCRWQKIAGGICAVVLLAAGCVHAGAYVRSRAERAGTYDIEALLLALPERGVVVADDIYTWQEIIRYFEHTNPYVAQRDLQLSNELRLRSSLRNFFFTGGVRAQMDELGLPYTPVLTNNARVLYMVGVPLPEPDQ
jgi:hypothetical protein